MNRFSFLTQPGAGIFLILCNKISIKDYLSQNIQKCKKYHSIFSVIRFPQSATELGAVAIKRALAKSGINQIDEVIMGCVLQAGLEQAPVRQAALFTGLDHTLPCTTVNKVCMSGMKAIMLSATTLSQGLQVSKPISYIPHLCAHQV